METSWEEFHNLLPPDPQDETGESHTDQPPAEIEAKSRQAEEPSQETLEYVAQLICGRSVEELDLDQVLTPGEAARLLHIKPKTISRWARRDKIESLRTPGGHRRFPLRGILVAVAKNRNYPQD